MLLKKEFSFDAAHNLIHYHGKCEKLHGHTYKLLITIEGVPDHEGMIIDFIQLKELVKAEILSKFDHAYINDFIEQPTAENIAQYIFRKLDAKLKAPNYSLAEVQVWETATSSVIFSRQDLS